MLQEKGSSVRVSVRDLSVCFRALVSDCSNTILLSPLHIFGSALDANCLLDRA